MILLCDFTKETMLFGPLLSDTRNKTLTPVFAEKVLGNTELQGIPLKQDHKFSGSEK